MSAHLSMAISRMKASSDVLSLLRAIVLMACKCEYRSNTVGTILYWKRGCWARVFWICLLHMCHNCCSSPQAAHRP